MPCDLLVKKPVAAEPRLESSRAVSGRGSESVGLKFMLGHCWPSAESEQHEAITAALLATGV